MTAKFDPDDAARISAALVKALAEGTMLAGAGEIGPALRDVIPEFRAQIRIFTPLSSVDGLVAEYSSSLPRPSGYACRGERSGQLGIGEA